MSKKPINVTQVYLPPQAEYNSILSRAWNKKWVTNRGDLVLKLEEEISRILDVDHLIATTNGTLPIQIALKLIPAGSEVITTPFSYVATSSCIIWEGHTPVYVDIEEDYLTINDQKIEEAITSKTKAILATHVYGNPCNVLEIERIAKKHGLLVIYDAAHAFGVEYMGRSLFQYGDINTCSFHATKIFHTGEGGCWTTNNAEIHKKMDFMHRFGHDGPAKYNGVGINAKMSELQAAMGLCLLPYMEQIHKKRESIVSEYDRSLSFSFFKRLKIRTNTKWNNHYYPVIFEEESELFQVVKKLNQQEIYPRRYFYPSLETLPYVESQVMPISSSIAKRVLCLPIFPDLELESVRLISQIINDI